MKVLRVLFLLFVFMLSLNAQNRVDYVFHIQDPCTGTASEFNGDFFLEGQSFVLKDQVLADLSAGLERFQPIYDALVGARFGLEDGSLLNDVTINIHLIGLTCENDNIIDPTGRGIEHFLYWGVVVQSDTSVFGFEDYFPLANGKRAFLKIPKSTAYLNLLSSLQIEPDSIAFTYYSENSVDPDGLSWEIGQDTTTLWLSHFSKFGGGKGRIRKLTGVNDYLVSNPDQYILDQNYPNPFNPSTTIRFSIPTNEHVDLIVYNILGNEVERLVNNTLASGTYEVDFNANNLASGIYFYSLRVGSNIITKKMLLMK